ncbi:transporter substrate-binding domain-containing protein [Roseibium sp. SCPC15]|uniref:substrate-binding periplasmic protein n=1 Tax=Roseibium sp. SCP15 TaxID=3141376 RepID=UPI00333D610E
MSVSFSRWTSRLVPVVLGFGLVLHLLTPANSAERIVAFTGFLPPLSIDEEHKGISVELMELVAEKAELEIDIRFAPWKRAQLLAENTSGSLLFTVAYTQTRSEKFQYIAPLIYTESAFVTLDAPLDTFEKAIAADKVIGVHLGSQRSRILKRMGATNFIEVSSAEQMTTMLQTGRIDAWYTMSMRAKYMFRQMGYEADQLIAGAPLTHGIQWLAANKDLDPDIRARLSAAVSKVWRDPRYWEIVDRYAN